MAGQAGQSDSAARRPWPDYAAVWRWHFYAGLFCLPFFCWLATTGSIYLFRPDIEALLDRPYESLEIHGQRAVPSAEARAAIMAVPGSTFSHYEPPATSTGAAQVVVAARDHLYRVTIHPTTLQPMRIGRDDHRPMDVIAHLHGQLLLGDRGSMIVELAGCWGVVMIITGLYLWIPRGSWRAGGLIYPRIGQRGRSFWRDLHAVTGFWISVVTLFLLLSGLPWSAAWGRYFTWVRNHWSVTAGTPDWPIGAKEEPAPRVATSPPAGAPKSSMPGMDAAEMTAMSSSAPKVDGSNGETGSDLGALDTLIPVAKRLDLPRPVWVSPPAPGMRDWTIASRAQDRPQRVTYAISPQTGAITGRSGFAQENAVDRVINVAIATHEGQLFGRINQAILLLNAMGVLLVSATAAVMWWRRKPTDVLGAPQRVVQPRFSAALLVIVICLALVLPEFGVSILLVLAIERTALRRLPKARRWLGLVSRTA